MARTPKQRRLPVNQFIVLAILRLAEPLVLTSVFPYLPEMMEFLGVKPKRVAFYAGLTSAIFSLCQFLTGVAWGRASDMVGRKPIVLLGVTWSMLTSLAFGLSTTLTWAITSRALGGLGSGNVGVLRTMVAEMVPYKELQPRAFSIMPLVWTVGSILGPAFGGSLANPVEKIPGLFGKSRFLTTFPYALPNMVAGVFFMFGLTAGFLFLKETLETKIHRRDYGIILGRKLINLFRRSKSKSKYQMAEDDEQSTGLLAHSRNTSSSSSTHVDDDESPPSRATKSSAPSYRDVFSRQSSLNLICYVFLALHSVAYDQLLPIFMHYPPQPPISTPFKFVGGFGLSSSSIGAIFTFYGIFGVLVQFFIFPTIARQFGVLRCFKACAIVFPIVYIVTPFTALLQTTIYQELAISIILVFKSACVIHAFPSSTILVTNSAKSLLLLGTLNGVATSVSALGRAAGPFIAGSLDTLGRMYGYAILPWFALAVIAAGGAIPIWWLVEMEGFGDREDEEESEDNEDNDENLEGRENAGEDDDPLPPAYEPQKKANTPNSSTSTRTAVICEEEEEEEEEDGNEDADSEEAIEDPPPSDETSAPRTHPARVINRRLSSPIGLKGGIGPRPRRLSSQLGSSNNGLGPGGTMGH